MATACLQIKGKEHQVLTFQEASTARRAAGLREKIPDIQKTLDMVKFLDSKKDSDEPITTNYELNDTLYARAKVSPSNTVLLWLGVSICVLSTQPTPIAYIQANVMLEYTIAEAIELLESKLAAAKKSLELCEEDLEFLKENITTMEVNTARVYNWDVQKRREERAQQGE